MRVSAGLPTGMEGLTYPIPFSDPETVVDVALHAETLGYDSVWGNDHLTTQRYVRAEFATPPRFWDPLVTYAYLAAATTRLRFGTGVLVLPLRRDIVVVAKQLATLDHFSGGRLELGVGIGAYREEFDAVAPHEGAARGGILDEGIEALTTLLGRSDTRTAVTFTGKHYQYEDIELEPKPLQPHIPLYVGGNHSNNLERVVRWADGWLPAGLPLGRIRADVAKLRELAAASGRDPASIEIAPQYVVHLGKSRAAAVARFRTTQMYAHLSSLSRSTLRDQGTIAHEDINLIGSGAEVLERAHALRDAGVTHLLGLYFAAGSPQELKDQMQWFAEDVMARL